MKPNTSHPTSSPDTLTPPSLRTLLSEVLDYAGLFPPANLPLDEAIRNYARYRQGREAWMLGRFVLPIGRLEDLVTYGHLFTQAPPFRFSVLGTGGSDPDAFLDAFDSDVKAINAFHARHRDQVLADVMEVRLPEALLDAKASVVEDFLSEADRRIVTSGLAELALFYEVPLVDLPAAKVRSVLKPLLAALADHNSRQPTPLRAEVGLKIRCGGMEPVYAPSSEQLAHAIVACREAGVRFKATAGLHHPVRHYNKEVDAVMHGFFNVFIAAVMAEAHDLDADALSALLAEEEADHFHFEPDALAWGDLEAPLPAVRRTRERLATGFGSCSFDEPRDDLREMGLL